MRENVGRVDQSFRVALSGLLGALAVAKYRKGARPLVPAALFVASSLVLESAITRVCPMNRLLGIDTRSKKERERDSERRTLRVPCLDDDIAAAQRLPADS